MLPPMSNLSDALTSHVRQQAEFRAPHDASGNRIPVDAMEVGHTVYVRQGDSLVAVEIVSLDPWMTLQKGEQRIPLPSPALEPEPEPEPRDD